MPLMLQLARAVHLARSVAGRYSARSGGEVGQEAVADHF
jgi:hypothetical protein